MRKGTSIRILAESDDQGTFSNFVLGGLAIYLGELPWRDDKHDLSCLPPARPAPGAPSETITYLLKSQWSEEHKRKLPHFIGVIKPDGSVGPMPDGRKLTMLHNGNLCGDVLKRFAAQVLGCGITGRAIVSFPKGEVFSTFTEGSPETLVKMPLAQTQKGVSSSVDALNALLAELGDEDLALAVTWS